MSDIIIDTDSGKFKAGDGQDLNLYHNGTNSFVENETGILYVTNKANANMVLGTNNSARLTIESDGAVNMANTLAVAGAVTVTTATNYAMTIKSTDADAADIFRVIADDDGALLTLSKDASDDAELYLYDGSGNANVQMQFVFDGSTQSNQNGSGYYFWMLDDLELVETPSYLMDVVD